MTTLVGFAAPTYGNDVLEGAGSLTHTLTLSAPSSQTVTVTVRGVNSTSTGWAGAADLGVADQVITFAPGQTTATFTTPILEDSLYEGNEVYQFTIISATGAEIDLTNTNARYLSGNIVDNDQPTTPLVGFAAPTYGNDVLESAGSLTHTLTLSAPSSQTVTVTVRGVNSTSTGWAGAADLGVADQVITFAPGQTTATFTTPILEDSLYEGNEVYQFTIISATGAEIDLTNTNARYLSGNIVDNDQPTTPLVGFAAPTYGNDVLESAGSLTHTLTLSAPSSQTVTVTVRGVNSTSTGWAGAADLGVADQVITFAPGQTTATFTTPILEDSLYEGNEVYQFTIISATGAEIDLTNTNARYLSGNIVDNDSSTTPNPTVPLTVRFAAPNGGNDVSESAGSLTHTLTLSAPSSQTVTVTVRGQNGTGPGSAGSADLGVADQIITFAPGQTTATFTTAIHEDSLYEGSEFYYFEIISATGAQIDLASGARQFYGNILDNDQPASPTVRFAAPNSGNDVSESAGSLTHTLTLSAPSSQTVTVTVRGQNGTGTGSAGSADLGVADQIITFAPGQTTATFTTAIHEDSLYEGSEFYYFEIISATGAQIDLASGARQFYGNILDNDQPASPTVRFAAPNSGNDVSESAGSLTHTLTLSAPSSQTVTVTVRGQNGTGTGSAGSADLGVADQVITFAPGQTTATFTTAIHEDSLYEGSEFYYFEIISATGAQIDLASGARQFYGNILDNDPLAANNAPVVANAIADQSSPEDTAWSFAIPANTFSDVDGGVLAYTASLADGSVLPGWLGFNAATRTFSGTPPANFNGQIVLKVTASDGLAAASDTFSLNLTAVNDAPIVASAIADQSSPEDTAWSFAIPANTFSDVDGGVLAYTASLADGSVLPGWLNFNAATRTFSGTPPANFNGQVALKVTASDGSLSASDTFTLAIAPVNDPPMVTSNAGGDTASVTVAENTTAVTTVTATDPDVVQTLSYSIVGGADETRFTINSTTGVLAFLTAPDFDAPTDADANNVYDVIVEVSDGNGTDTQAVTVTVQNTAGVTISGTNQAQTIVGTGEEDSLSGLGGNDVLQGLAGPDLLDGGGGTDSASYAASSTGVTVSLTSGTATGGDAQGDTLIRIENITGSNFGDTLEGNSGNNVLSGGAGNDTVSYAHAAAGVTVSLGVTAAQNTGGAGNDTLISFENLTGSTFADVLTGSSGANVLDGLDGNDRLIGGGGADTLTGGAGADRFLFKALSDSTVSNADVITDYVHGSDLFDLSALDANSSIKKDQAFAFGGEALNVIANSVTWYESGGDTIVQADVNGNATADVMFVLTGVNHNLTASDFLL